MNRPILGIDISKLKFNVCLILTAGKLKHKVFPERFFRLRAALTLAFTTQCHQCSRRSRSYRHIRRSTGALSRANSSNGELGQSSSRQILCWIITHQKRQSGCRVDCSLLPLATTCCMEAASSGNTPVASSGAKSGIAD